MHKLEFYVSFVSYRETLVFDCMPVWCSVTEKLIGDCVVDSGRPTQSYCVAL